MFNTTKTPLKNTKQSLQDVVAKFSKENNPVVDLLVDVAERLENGNNDSRGVYVEHDNFECKPYSTKTVELAQRYGLATFHSDSEDGVAFMTVHQDLVDVLEQYGLFTPESELV